jgi:hypothetical protein
MVQEPCIVIAMSPPLHFTVTNGRITSENARRVVFVVAAVSA